MKQKNAKGDQFLRTVFRKNVEFYFYYHHVPEMESSSLAYQFLTSARALVPRPHFPVSTKCANNNLLKKYFKKKAPPG